MLITDSREPKEIKERLKKNKAIPFKEQFIEVGDYLLPDGYAIERKKGRDLMSSVLSNRLFEQLFNLCEFEHPVLAIITDNVWKEFYFSKSKYIHKQYIGLLSTLTCKYPNLKVMFFDSDDMFLSYLESLYKKLTSDSNGERPKPIMRKAKSLQMKKENMLCAIDGVSVKTAKRLLKKYKTIERLCNVDEKDFECIEKIGKVQAKRIFEILHS